MASPFLALIEELRALRGHPKVSYPDGHEDYPVTERVLRIKRGQHLPDFGTDEPDAARFPDNILTQHVEVASDAQWVEVYRKYEVLPGLVVTVSDDTDEASDSRVVVTKQRKLRSAITTGNFKADDNTNVWKIALEGIDDTTAYEIKTKIFDSPHNDLASAKLSDEMLPYQFKGRINIGTLDLHGTAIGHQTPQSDTVLHTSRTFWVISATKPTLEFDEMSPGDIVINDVSYKNVLHNETTRIYLGGPLTIPATVPSYSNYTGITEILVPSGTIAPDAPDAPWVGTQRVIRGGVEPAGSPYRWKVTSTEVEMR